jgi:hypothetical protein
MANKAKASERAWNNGLRLDMAAASPRLRRKILRIPVGAFTASSTVKHSAGAFGYPGTIKAAYLSCKTLPNIATSATVRLVAYDASANAEVNITEAFDVEDTTTALVAREAAAMTLAATNTAFDADDTIEVHVIAGGAITTNIADGHVVLVFDATEDTTIDD